jgi:hypothetical protein
LCGAPKEATALRASISQTARILTQHHPMLQHNLLYTGVTCGRRLVVLVRQKKAVAIAIRNFRADHEGKAEWGREVFERRVRRQISPRPRRTQGQMPSHVRHRRTRRRSDHPCRRLQDRSCLTHSASPPPGAGKFTSLRVFYKKL